MHRKTSKAYVVSSDGVSQLQDLTKFNSSQPASTQTGNRNSLTIIRMNYKGKDCFTITNRNVIQQVDVFFQIDSSILFSVERVLCKLGVASNVVSVNPIRKCGESQDYEVIFNMPESKEYKVMQIGKIEKGCKAIKSLPTLDNRYLDSFLSYADSQTKHDVKQAIKEVIEKRRQDLESELRKLLD